MKKRNLTNLFIAALFMITIASCGSSIESDAKEAAK